MIEIRVLGMADADTLQRVAVGVFDNSIDPERTREFLADPRHHIVVAIDDGFVVGFASAVHYVHPDKAPELWVNEVGVAPSHVRQGLARRILEETFSHGRTLGCNEGWVLTEDANEAANGLYTALGGARADDPVLYSWRLGERED